MQKNLIQISGIKNQIEAELLLTEDADLLTYTLTETKVDDDISKFLFPTNLTDKFVFFTYLSDGEEILEYAKLLGINTIQLQSTIQIRELEKIKISLPNIKIILSITVGDLTESKIEKLIHYSFPFVDYFSIHGIVAPEVHNYWQMCTELVKISPKPVILADGLNANNVAEAIRIVKPGGVNFYINSQYATDIQLIRNFMKNARSAFAEVSQKSDFFCENSDTLDLHNFNPKDVKDLIHDFIQASIEEGYREIRIIHGKGIGVLRNIVHAELKKNKHVLNFRLASDQFSSWGATTCKLKNGFKL